MATLTIPKPNPKQALFFQAHCKYVGYGGARGGGKSWALRTKAKLLAYRYPGISILIIRRSYPELEANHINVLVAELCPTFAKYNSTKKQMTFPNGSSIKFQYCQKDADLQRIQGTEYDVIMIDECTMLTEYQMKAITACCRGTNEFPKRVYFTTNPGGPGHQYMKRVFIDRNFTKQENPEDFTFIQALVDDNYALMEAQPDYVEQLDALSDKLRMAWRYGRWDVFEGQVFTEWTDDPEHYQDRKWTHVIDPFEVPRDWPVYRGFDWGYSKPFSVGWYAFDGEDRMYRIREFYGCTGSPDVGVEWSIDRVAREIAEIERTDPLLQGRHIIGIADPAIFQENGGPSIAETMRKYQVHFRRGDHQRLPGKMQCHYRLAFNDDGIPMFYVFNTCKHFLRTIPALIYSETQVEDVDTKTEDHQYDEWRYCCMARAIGPREKKVVRKIDVDNVEDPLNMIREQQEKTRNASRYDFVLSHI